MNSVTKGIAVAAIAIAAQAGVAHAAPFTLDSDAEFGTWAADNSFSKLFGGNVRWGNGAENGDWEFSVVDGSDMPVDQQQHAWGEGDNEHTSSFYFNANTGDATLSLGGIGQSDGNFFEAMPNTLFLRAAENMDQTAAMLDNILIEFADDTAINLGSLIGDSDAQWIGYVDPRLAMGFSVTTQSALIDGGKTGRGSRPMYQYKVGISEVTDVPEPASIGLMAAGLIGAGVLRRRARKA